MRTSWLNLTNVKSRNWICGFCGNEVAGSVGYHCDNDYPSLPEDSILICPHCDNPTLFLVGDFMRVLQIPAPLAGHDVDELPDDIESVYDEARICIQYSAFTSAVLMLRKLIMHIAVEKGAPENCSFVSYIDYLQDNNWLPPNGKEWADQIRKQGNQSTHEIVLADREVAVTLLEFCEMILKFSYEFPNKLNSIK